MGVKTNSMSYASTRGLCRLRHFIKETEHLLFFFVVSKTSFPNEQSTPPQDSDYRIAISDWLLLQITENFDCQTENNEQMWGRGSSIFSYVYKDFMNVDQCYYVIFTPRSITHLCTFSTQHSTRKRTPPSLPYSPLPFSSIQFINSIYKLKIS